MSREQNLELSGQEAAEAYINRYSERIANFDKKDNGIMNVDYDKALEFAKALNDGLLVGMESEE